MEDIKRSKHWDTSRYDLIRLLEEAVIETIKETPNDADLGAKLRKMLNDGTL